MNQSSRTSGRRGVAALLGALLLCSTATGQAAAAAPEKDSTTASTPAATAVGPTGDDVLISQRMQALVAPVLGIAADSQVRSLVRTIAARQTDGDTDALLLTVWQEAEESGIVNTSDPKWIAFKNALPSLGIINGYTYFPQVYIPNLDEGLPTSSTVVVAVAPADESAESAAGYVLNASGQVVNTTAPVTEAVAAAQEVWVLSADEPDPGSGGASGVPVLHAEPADEVFGAAVTCNPTGLRNNKGQEYLQRWRLKDKRSFGGLFEGKREMRALVITSAGATMRTIVFPSVKKKNIESWQNSDLFVTTWDRALWGDVLAYQWYEEDGGPEITVGVKIPIYGVELGVNVKWAARDDNAGNTVVVFEEPTSTPYSTGSVEMNVCGQGGEGGTGNDNLACGSTASASSTYTGYSASRVNDCKRDTTLGAPHSWSNAAGTYPPSNPEWVQVDFGVTKTVRRAVVHTTASYPIRDFDVQVWNGVTYLTVASVRGNTSPSATVTFADRSTRLVRVLAHSGPTHQPGFARVNELEVYAT
ncbi:discoidin domain-containing protein [Umezawaea sp.]|uniref:discoidin domain-containing protein n=1 Tax=Umezawaea sp. TaxID=1955258 RepID=UPI002ED3ECCE